MADSKIRAGLDASHMTEKEAAFALLTDVTRTLLDSGVNFVIVGGWVPFLFHAQRFGHPGTYDVDVLVHASSLDDGSFDRAGERLLLNGYLRAVKNKFQVHQVIQVADEKFVFHVDFLNEHHPGEELNLIGGGGKIKSIYTPAMEAVFKYAGYRAHPKLEGVRFPSVETFIATKAMAARVKKRNRDAFDVFVSVADQDRSEFRSRWHELLIDGLFRAANAALWEAVHHEDGLEKIEAVLIELSSAPRPSADEIRRMFDFLAEPASRES